jgi:hypothetical protein
MNRMEDKTKKITFWAEKTLTREEIRSCTSLVEPEKGIINVLSEDRSVSFEFNPYMISEKKINDLFRGLKIKFSHSPKKIGFIKKWLLNMAEENKKNFGNQSMDCCSMNAKNTKK